MRGRAHGAGEGQLRLLPLVPCQRQQPTFDTLSCGGGSTTMGSAGRIGLLLL